MSYTKLKVMMKKSMLKGLPELDVMEDIICAGCQFSKAHQLPYEDSKFKSQAPLEHIHSDVFGLVKQYSVSGLAIHVGFRVIFHVASKLDDKCKNWFIVSLGCSLVVLVMFDVCFVLLPFCVLGSSFLL